MSDRTSTQILRVRIAEKLKRRQEAEKPKDQQSDGIVVTFGLEDPEESSEDDQDAP